MKTCCFLKLKTALKDILFGWKAVIELLLNSSSATNTVEQENRVNIQKLLQQFPHVKSLLSNSVTGSSLIFNNITSYHCLLSILELKVLHFKSSPSILSPPSLTNTGSLLGKNILQFLILSHIVDIYAEVKVRSD